MKTYWLACTLLAGLILTGCSTLRVGSDFDHSASFSGYHTFNLMAREHHGSDNPLVVQRARDAIEAELLRKGFTASEPAGQADFVVDFTIGARDRMDVQSYPDAYVGYGFWDARGWWEPYWGSQLDVRQYREGTLSIDVFDPKAHRPVWHGWAKKELTRSDIEHSEAPIRAAVAAVLQSFPPH
jgi:hypothetical protein